MDKARLLSAIVACGCLGWGPQALASSLEERLDEAYGFIKEGDRRATNRALDLARSAATEAEGIVQHDQLARYWFYRGMAMHGRKRSKVYMGHWRRTLVVDNEFDWDRTLSEDLNGRRLFEALRREVQQDGSVDPRVPEKTGLAQLYIDGTRVTDETRITRGEHLAQIQCPEGAVRGDWVNFSRGRLAWFDMCPHPVDTSVVLADVFGESEFGGMAPDFEDPGLPSAPPPAPEPIAESQPEAGEVGPEEPASSPDASADNSDGSGGGWVSPRSLSLAGGGALVAAGIAVNFVMVEPAWTSIEVARAEPRSVTRDEADSLTARFDQGRAIALGLMGAGMVVGATGYMLLDGALRPELGLAKVGLSGRF